jgi:hypothetical protein
MNEPEFVRARITDPQAGAPGLADEVWIKAGSLDGRSATPVGVWEVPETGTMPLLARPAFQLEYL